MVVRMDWVAGRNPVKLAVVGQMAIALAAVMVGRRDLLVFVWVGRKTMDSAVVCLLGQRDLGLVLEPQKDCFVLELRAGRRGLMLRLLADWKADQKGLQRLLLGQKVLHYRKQEPAAGWMVYQMDLVLDLMQRARRSRLEQMACQMQRLGLVVKADRNWTVAWEPMAGQRPMVGRALKVDQTLKAQMVVQKMKAQMAVQKLTVQMVVQKRRTQMVVQKLKAQMVVRKLKAQMAVQRPKLQKVDRRLMAELAQTVHQIRLRERRILHWIEARLGWTVENLWQKHLYFDLTFACYIHQRWPIGCLAPSSHSLHTELHLSCQRGPFRSHHWPPVPLQIPLVANQDISLRFDELLTGLY
jgi:hypothetical protein